MNKKNDLTYKKEFKFYKFSTKKSRADGIDDIAGIIFELKPQTPKTMFTGLKQLERYEQGALRNEGLKKIAKWIRILVTYETK